MMKPKLLIIEDDEDIQTQMKWALAREYDVLLASDCASAIALLRAERPAVILLDLGLPPQPTSIEEGMATLSEILRIDRHVKVIVISGQGEKGNVIEVIGAGAWDFLCKPVDIGALKMLLARCFYVAGIEKEYQELQKVTSPDTFEGMIGTSQSIRNIFATIRKVAGSSASVLILGKSGTGKEMVARAIHNRSHCKAGPFVAINCNAIPESLMESELFGHEKGAFTGANTLRTGLIESASGGTLFLDEIGEMPLSIQVKLLRFLQERTFQRVGGRQEIQSDVRLVAATNATLQEMVSAGTFREDLYFRIAVITLKLPALAEREDDVILIAKNFLERFSKQNGHKGINFSPDCLRAMRKHLWPGNIRELQNRVQRAVILADGKRISVADMELEPGEASPNTLRSAREQVEREVIITALRRNSGKISATATELGVSRPTLYELMEKLGIQGQ